MNNKTKFALIATTIASVFSVACAVFAFNKVSPLLKGKGTVVAENWYEKAYVAPTGSSVGYKHYFLGCPGNYRTADGEHESSVSLEDITIPMLNVIDSSEVASGSEILNVRNAKIRWVDQCTTLGSDGGTPVYVTDAGHQAVFFSRSNNLANDPAAAHASEFRFTFSEKQNLNSVTFDYRYLDYGNRVETGVSERHIYTQFHTSSYVNAYFDFVNDDEWHTATIYTDNTTKNGATELLINIYDLQGHIYISNLQYHGFSEMDLTATSGYEAIEPITISDLGIQSGITLPSSAVAHTYGEYDFNAHKGIDLWFKPEYSIHAADWGFMYLFNKRVAGKEEAGIVFRYDFGRTEDDGYLYSYIYTQYSYPGSTVVQTAGSAGTSFIFPYASHITSTADVRFHVTAYCIDPATNTYRCSFKAGVSGGTLYAPNNRATPDDFSSAAEYFDIVLGSDFFDDGAATYVRFSSTSDDHKIWDADSEEQYVVYKDADGSVMGKKAGTTINTFDYQRPGKQLVGWFDHKGNKVSDNQVVSSKTIVQPLFVDTQTDMLVPSTIMMGTRNNWVEVTESTSAYASEIGYTPSDSRIDMYFIYNVTARTGADNWARFGFPYDYLDAKSRLSIRINENDNNRLDGYIYGASLGAAGNEGTYYNLGNSFRKMSDQLLVHLTIVDNGENNIDFTLEVINLRTREIGSTTKNVTFTEYSSATWARNKMALESSVGCEWRFIDAF